MKQLFKDHRFQVLLGLLILFASWWVYLYVSGISPENSLSIFFTSTYGLLALLGGVFGLGIAGRWGGLKSQMGRVLTLFSLGLLSQEFGQIFYTYLYHTSTSLTPSYPSVADVGFLGSSLFYILALIGLIKLLTKALPRVSKPTTLAIVAGCALFISASVLLMIRGYIIEGPVTAANILDFSYTLIYAVYLVLASVVIYLSVGRVGGLMASRIRVLCFSLIAHFVADYSYVYEASHGLYTSSGINDLFYCLAFFLVAAAIVWSSPVVIFSEKKPLVPIVESSNLSAGFELNRIFAQIVNRLPQRLRPSQT